MPIYLFWGEEEFNLENAVRDLREKIVDLDWALLNHKVFNKPGITDLIDNLRTMPMSMGNLLIEIRAANLFLRGSKKTSDDNDSENNNKISGSDPLMKKLLDILESVNDNTHILFVCQIPRDSGKKIDSASKLVKTIQKIGEIREFSPLKFYQDEKLISWIIQRAKVKEVKISTDAAKILLENTGPELKRLDSELEKLKTNAYPAKMITKDNVIALCSGHENVFLLADYWLQDNKIKAITELNKLFERNHPLKITATLQTTIRRWLKIKIESQTKNSFEISKIVNLHKFVVEKELQKLRNISVERLIGLKNKLTQAEYKIKAGELEPETSLELVILSC